MSFLFFEVMIDFFKPLCILLQFANLILKSVDFVLLELFNLFDSLFNVILMLVVEELRSFLQVV